uniref:G_PROTEIN_RECEP_F1_2 domain-containing protein n=1 Tax=Globodera pallida TaxID=36090 RepID=A0A183BKF7_GLOPA
MTAPALWLHLDQNESLLNIAVGCAIVATSALCLTLNLIVIKAIIADKNYLLKLNCYKFILALCLVDCTQSIVLGAIATSSYIFYAIITIVLAINRLTVIVLHRTEKFLFSSVCIKFWFLLPALISLSFSLALCSPWAAISYSPDQFSWAYDESRPLSNLVQSLEEIIEVAGIPIAGLIYGVIFFAILYKRINGLVLRQTGAVAERKVLIQAFVITAYCTVLNYLWHNSKWLLPNTKTAKCALNFMWICNGAVNPFIYLAVNSTIRQRIVAVFVTTPNVAPRNFQTNLPMEMKGIPMQNNFFLN